MEIGNRYRYKFSLGDNYRYAEKMKHAVKIMEYIGGETMEFTVRTF